MGDTGFCSSCGEKLPENVKFCTNCGTPVSGAEKSQAPPPQQSSPTPLVYTPPMPGQPLQTGGQLPPARKGMSKGVMALIIVASIGVLVIVGAIVGITLTVSNGAREKADKRTCQANLRTIDGAVQMYYAENEKYPTGVDQLVPDYLKEVPKCPSGDKPYQLKGDPPSAYCPNVSSHNLDY